MAPDTKAMGRRYRQLTEGGMSGKEACSKVREEFNTKAKDASIRGYASRADKPATKLSESSGMKRTAKTSKSAPIGKVQKYATKKDLESLRKELIDMITTTSGVGTSPKVSDTTELVPVTPRDGKAFLGKREKLGVTVDSVLFGLLEGDCQEREVSASRMLDTVLWHYYGRPKLSYEIDREYILKQGDSELGVYPSLDDAKAARKEFRADSATSEEPIKIHRRDTTTGEIKVLTKKRKRAKG